MHRKRKSSFWNFPFWISLSDLEEQMRWLSLYIRLVSVTSGPLLVHELFLTAYELSTDIESKNLETFIAIWRCHNIKMQDRQTRWTVYRSKTLVCDNWKWNEIIFTTDCLIFSSCALVWCFRLTEMLWTQRKEELEGSKSVENFSVPHILCPSPRSPSIAINGGQGAGSGRGKLPTGEQVISLTDWEIGMGRNPRPFFK